MAEIIREDISGGMGKGMTEVIGGEMAKVMVDDRGHGR